LKTVIIYNFKLKQYKLTDDRGLICFCLISISQFLNKQSLLLNRVENDYGIVWLVLEKRVEEKSLNFTGWVNSQSASVSIEIYNYVMVWTGFSNQNSDIFTCENKNLKCSEIKSCDEAKFYLNSCWNKKLDQDSDGIPCEALCK